MNKEEKIRELCKEHNIDAELVFEFVAETKAFPFLMGEPSSYLIAYIGNQKGIKIEKDIIKSFMFDRETEEILLILSARGERWKAKCNYCKKEVYDYLRLINSKTQQESHVCFNCFTEKTLSFYLKIPEKRISEYFSKLSENKLDRQIIKIYLLTIASYYSDLFTRPNLKRTLSTFKFDLLTKSIKSDTFDLKIFFDQFVYLRTYSDRIILLGVLREVYVNRRETYEFDHKNFLDQIIKSLTPKLDKPLKDMKEIMNNSSQYFGRRMAPWIVENKTGRATHAYVLEIIRETERAILCRYTLLDNKKIHQDWVPKSTLDPVSTHFHSYILKKSLERMGFSE